MSDPGAKAEMVDVRGVRFDCVVLEEINRQNVKLKTADPESRVGHLVVDGVVQVPPVTVENTMATVMWTFGREELIGHEVPGAGCPICQ